MSASTTPPACGIVGCRPTLAPQPPTMIASAIASVANRKRPIANGISFEHYV
jgi:hypothetical protein